MYKKKFPGGRQRGNGAEKDGILVILMCFLWRVGCLFPFL